MAKKTKLEVDLIDVSKEMVVTPKESHSDAVKRVVKAMFPDWEENADNWRRDVFYGIYMKVFNGPRGWSRPMYNTNLKGIVLWVDGPGYKSVIRRVMIKDGKIDRADFKRKSDELKIQIKKAEEYKKSQHDSDVAKARARYQALTDAGYDVSKDRHWESPAGIHIKMETEKSGSVQLYFYSQESLTEFLKLYKKLHPPVRTTTEVGD